MTKITMEVEVVTVITGITGPDKNQANKPAKAKLDKQERTGPILPTNNHTQTTIIEVTYGKQSIHLEF